VSKPGEPDAGSIARTGPDANPGADPSTDKAPTYYDAQGDALASIRSALDDASSRLESATADRDAVVGKADAQRDRRIRETDAQLAKALRSVQAGAQETRSQIESIHQSKGAAARTEFATRQAEARNKHARAVGKSKKEREESIWLADTMLESALRIENAEFKSIADRVTKQTEYVQQLEIGLAQTIGTLPPREQGERPLPEEPTSDGLNRAIDKAARALGTFTGGGIRRLLRGRTTKGALKAEAIECIGTARAYAEGLVAAEQHAHAGRVAALKEKRNTETGYADRAYRLTLQNCDRSTGGSVREASAALAARNKELDARQAHDLAKLKDWIAAKEADAHAAHAGAIASAHDEHADHTRDAVAAFAEIHTSTTEQLRASIESSTASIDRVRQQAQHAHPAWDRLAATPQPVEVPRVVPFAVARQDLQPRLDRLDHLDRALRDTLGLPPVLETPAVLDLPGPRSLVLRHDAEGRQLALDSTRSVVLRILASLPAGKARFVMADPIGMGQSFAGFMSLSDHEPSAVGQRIWTDPMQIERQLSDVTEHMQTVIQKYLRADFETIEDYNRAAGEIAEPYRFVLISDLHAALTDNGAAKLVSIIESGPRCGVYALLTHDAATRLPGELETSLDLGAVRVSVTDGVSRVDAPRFEGVEIELERPPSDDVAGEILERIAEAGAGAGRVEVPFERLAPTTDQLWTRSCDDELVIPLGRSGARKTQELRLGSGTRQHALVAGRTGSGKSTLLHVIVTAAAMWHAPDELEMYLIDFKKGVEFKAYTDGTMPHIRAVAIESDREFGLSVLQRLDDEMTQRGEMFRKIGAQNLAAARTAMPDTPLPRSLLLIDEFQEFFTEDDDVASQAALLLDRLVRQGRAFGVHVVLGSQTLAGAFSLARSTLGQIGVRIALQCAEADSYLILGEDNSAARLLERPGEAIYNNAGGLVEGNSPFQVAWLPDADRDAMLARLPKPTVAGPQPVVFEGNRPAKIDVSAEAFVGAYPTRTVPRALLGDAVMIAPPTSAALERRSGSNLLVVSQQPEAALGMITASAISAGSSANCRTIVIDPTPTDDALAGRVERALLASGIGPIEILAPDDAARAVAEANSIVQERGEHGGDPVLLVLCGLHRLRSLRKSDDYSFSLDEGGASSPDKDLASVLRDGPSAGVWTLAWCDTLTNLERALERATVREFGLRAITQMGASDSAALVDSSIASTLGANRAILVDDTAGTIQKFRPIELPDEDSARRAGELLRAQRS